MLWSTLLVTFYLAVAANLSYALDNGVGRLPVMGFNAWNAFQCNVNEDTILETANLMKSYGLQEAGYTHVNLDDCWAEKNRSSTGSLVADSTKFPSGLKSMTTQLHSLGFKAGIYGDSGWFTCAGYPGSFQNEEEDVQTFVNWGFDFLKYDNCAIPFDSILRQNTMGKYQRMSDAISSVSKSSGKPPLIFSLCEWGWSQVWLWGSQFGQSWRIDGDIEPYWSAITSIINSASFITMGTNLNGRNDLDMLQIGNGNLTFDESKSHFTAWALMKAPLLIGTNLSSISVENLSILNNKEIIAINQDPVEGTSISPFRWGLYADWTSNSDFPAQYWSGPSQNGTVVMLLNTLDEPSDMFFNLTESPWIRAGIQYSVRDLWTHTNNGTAIRNFTAHEVPGHGVVALLLQDDGDEPAGLYPLCALWYQCTAENGTSEGG